MLKKIWPILMISVLGIYIWACSQPQTNPPPSQSTPAILQATPPIKPQPEYPELVYEEISFDEIIKTANLIALVNVVDISRTVWNQDNGEIWYEEPTTSSDPIISSPLQIHYVTFEVLQMIIGSNQPEEKFILTVVGQSPIDGNSDNHLEVGQEGILFARNTELTWRDGTKPVMMFMGIPGQSFLVKQAGGLFTGELVKTPISLDELIAQVEQARE